jgi:hypothetical protein
MAIASTTSDYTGRKKDISVLQYPNAILIGPQSVQLEFGKHPRFCSGVQKLVQKYAVILLTNLNSQPNYTDFGTSLLYTLKAGISPVDTLRASQLFRLASYITVNTLKAYQTEHDDIPLDERITNATLTDVSLYGGSAAFSVTIATEAGSSLNYLIPLPK